MALPRKSIAAVGVLASVVGLLLVIVFLVGYYRWSGINAVVALLFNLVILLGLFTLLDY
jgi:preprotein translocase subunit SecD